MKRKRNAGQRCRDAPTPDFGAARLHPGYGGWKQQPQRHGGKQQIFPASNRRPHPALDLGHFR